MTVQQFINDESFRQWVYQNLPDEATYWTDYLTQHPAEQANANLARTFLLNVRGELPTLTDEQVQTHIRQLMGAVESADETVVRPLHPPIRWAAMPLRVAASIVLLLVASWFGWQSWKTTPPAVSTQAKPIAVTALTNVVNTRSVAQPVRLPDGSLVLLQPQARLRFARVFGGNRREVYLSGSAFFEVVKNPARPFRVYAHHLTTEVVGTSFAVSAAMAGGVRVAVKTGKVAVFKQEQAGEHPKQDRVLLLPNEQVTFAHNQAVLVKSTVKQPVRVGLPALALSFTFRRTPLAEVLQTLEKAYGIQIQFNRASVGHATLTAHLGDTSLFEKLDIITASTGTAYQVQAGLIVVE